MLNYIRRLLATTVRLELAGLANQVKSLSDQVANGPSSQDIADLHQRISALDEKIAGLDTRITEGLRAASASFENQLGVLQGQILAKIEDLARRAPSVEALSAEIVALRAEASRQERIAWLGKRANAIRCSPLVYQRGSQEPPVLYPSGQAEIEAQLSELRHRAPLNFDLWQQRFEAGRVEYEKRLPSSLSTDAHREAFYFREFVVVHARGRVLDIGVGPLAKPAYLQDIENARIAALDPLLPFEPHPFPFAQGFAEFLPWSDECFETIIAATSVDHVYLLDVAIAEIRRVLAPGGVFLLWSGIFPETVPYDPYSACITPPDDYHLFHPGENWFPGLLTRTFQLRERFDISTVGFANTFLALQKDG